MGFSFGAGTCKKKPSRVCRDGHISNWSVQLKTRGKARECLFYIKCKHADVLKKSFKFIAHYCFSNTCRSTCKNDIANIH